MVQSGEEIARALSRKHNMDATDDSFTLTLLVPISSQADVEERIDIIVDRRPNNEGKKGYKYPNGDRIVERAARLRDDGDKFDIAIKLYIFGGPDAPEPHVTVSPDMERIILALNAADADLELRMWTEEGGADPS